MGRADRESMNAKVADYRRPNGLLPELQSLHPAAVYPLRSLREIHHLPVTESPKEHSGS